MEADTSAVSLLFFLHVYPRVDDSEVGAAVVGRCLHVRIRSIIGERGLPVFGRGWSAVTIVYHGRYVLRSTLRRLQSDHPVSAVPATRQRCVQLSMGEDVARPVGSRGR